MGRKDWIGVERGRQAGNAGKTGEAGATRRFLFAAADQRASARERQNAGQAGETSLWRDSRKRRAASERGCAYAGVAEPRPQPAAVVPGGLQSEYSSAATAAPARPPEAPRRKPSSEVNSQDENQALKVGSAGTRPNKGASRR